MAVIRNNHSGPLKVGNANIPPGSEAVVEKWRIVKKGDVVSQWLDADILEVIEDDPELSGDEAKREDLEKQAFELGIKVNNSWKDTTLERKINEALEGK